MPDMSLSNLTADEEAAALRFYGRRCANCHGKDMTGGMGKSLIDGVWMHGSSNRDIKRNIRQGINYAGMPEFGSVLDDAELNRMVALIRQTEEKASGEIR